MNDRDRILDKIKKCLRLSKSSNEHEAAAALRQARKLMDQLQLTEADVLASEAAEARAKSGASSRPVSWEASLADVVASTIGCETIFASSYHGKGHWMFIGCGGAEKAAEYAFVALMRHVKRCRSQYIEAELRRCRPETKRRRADVYCSGWISAVRAKVEPLALTEIQRGAIAAYKQGRYVTESIKPLQRHGKSIGGRNLDDWINGRRAGQDVDLRSPLNSGDMPEALPQ